MTANALHRWSPLPQRRHGQALAVVCLLALASCTHAQAYVATGESIDALGQAFLATGKAFDAAYDAHRMDEGQYAKWRAFVPHFQALYASASDRWLHADDSAAEHAAAVLAALSAELATFALPPKGGP